MSLEFDDDVAMMDRAALMKERRIVANKFAQLCLIEYAISQRPHDLDFTFVVRRHSLLTVRDPLLEAAQHPEKFVEFEDATPTINRNERELDE